MRLLLILMNHFPRPGLLALILSFTALSAPAQFKEIKAAPFSPAIARQKIRTLLADATPTNRDQTVATLSGWLTWYRDILDEEMIARWKTDGRSNLPLLMTPLADDRIAHEIVDYSWRVDRPSAFTVAYAATLGDLMERYPESAKPFLDELLPGPVNLTQSEAEAVCRILLDMPDIGSWRKNALQILPRYRAAADQLTKQDMQSPDQERMYRALRWRSDLRLDPPPPVNSQRTTTVRPSRSASAYQQAPPDMNSQRPHIVGQQSGYTGPMSGTFQSTGEPIPQNGEYVFPNIPPVHLMLDFDTKHWEARLAPGDGQTQILVLKNIGKGPQKRVVVRWTVVP